MANVFNAFNVCQFIACESSHLLSRVFGERPIKVVVSPEHWAQVTPEGAAQRELISIAMPNMSEMLALTPEEVSDRLSHEFGFGLVC